MYGLVVTWRNSPTDKEGTPVTTAFAQKPSSRSKTRFFLYIKSIPTKTNHYFLFFCSRFMFPPCHARRTIGHLIHWHVMAETIDGTKRVRVRMDMFGFHACHDFVRFYHALLWLQILKLINDSVVEAGAHGSFVSRCLWLFKLGILNEF